MRMCAVSYGRHNMKKLFKSFLALVMVAALGISAAIPSMAAEYEMTGIDPESVSMTNTEGRAGTQVGGMSGKCNIKEGSIIGTCYVGTGAKTIEVTITGVSGLIILEFDNLTTGDHRSLTAIGGQEKYSLEYASTLDSGDWQCSVRMCQNKASNCYYDINFYR